MNRSEQVHSFNLVFTGFYFLIFWDLYNQVVEILHVLSSEMYLQFNFFVEIKVDVELSTHYTILFILWSGLEEKKKV